jgi:hypothetical protein
LALAAVCVGLTCQPAAQNPLLPFPDAMATAAPEFIDRLRADPFTYFRFINRAWTARVCEAFADIRDPTIVHLHGDAHVEQFAYTKDAWGLHDFDDSTRGPAYVDIVRFLGSIDLATRQRGWTRDREALWNRFFAGYLRGLAESDYRPPELSLIRWLRQRAPRSRAASLAWGESQMRPMQEAQSRAVVTGMAALERLVRANRSDLAPGYLSVVRAGWLRIGVGSAATRKVLVRVQGRTPNPADDLLVEAKEVANLGGLPCLEDSMTPQAARVIAGTRQLGRLKHDILAIGPTMLIPAAADRAEHWLDWWISSWEPTYQEVQLSDLRSVDDLADIAYDAGVQLGASKLVSERKQVLSSVTALEGRLRMETARIVEELLAGWRQLTVR